MSQDPSKHKAVREPAVVAASSFKATCLEVMDEVARTGRGVLVTKHGRAVVLVSPAQAATETPWGFLQGAIARHGDIVTADERPWTASPTDPLQSRRPRGGRHG